MNFFKKYIYRYFVIYYGIKNNRNKIGLHHSQNNSDKQ